MLFISWTSYPVCLFEFIRVEGGVNFMKLIRGEGHAMKVWEPFVYRFLPDTNSEWSRTLWRNELGRSVLPRWRDSGTMA
jgi:hypothetical protein